MRPVFAADLFCGAGGTSQGLARACERLARPVELVAVNHWPLAVETHKRNHPWARHHCARVESLDPRKVFPSREVDLIVAGCECTHHSRARGGRPMSDQSRASAWNVLDWAEKLRARDVLIENVPEFIQWGPLDEEGHPIPERKGETFDAFLSALRSLGYTVDWRVLTAADYGDATTRARFFLRARLGGRPIHWPEQSHAKVPRDGQKPWRTAREIIDWTDIGESIFAKRRPLVPRTLARIEEGVRRFCGPFTDVFLALLRGDVGPGSAESPAGVGFPFILPHDQFTARNGVSLVDSVDAPVRTITAVNGGDNYLVTPALMPFLLPVNGPYRPREEQAPRSIDRPLNTVVRASRGAGHVVTPFLVPCYGDSRSQVRPRVRSLDLPVPRVTTENVGALISPFLLALYGTNTVRSLDRPLSTVTAGGGHAALAAPFILPYYGTGVADSVEEPLATVTTRDRFALTTPVIGYGLDIFHRMLRPQELARGQGFPESYQFLGNKKDVVRQIGNAVPTHTAEALCHAILDDRGTNFAGEAII